jgi:hypothetical protein
VSGPRRLEDLPTFAMVRVRAFRSLGDVRDELRSDCRPGGGPTVRQSVAVRRALGAIRDAQAALDQATGR